VTAFIGSIFIGVGMALYLRIHRADIRRWYARRRTMRAVRERRATEAQRYLERAP
jgi:hypothetical protein